MEPKIRYGKQHLVRQGETLTEIATKIRPQGMTVEQTIQALVNANPGVFIGKDADRMLAGKVLYIPMHGGYEIDGIQTRTSQTSGSGRQ